MYLPTFWKLTTEATMYRGRHMAGWLLPASLMVAWIGFPSFYNWTYTTIIPPPTGVAKRHGSLDWARYVETDRVRFSGLILFYVLLNLNTSCLGYTMVQKSLLLFYGLTSLIICSFAVKIWPPKLRSSQSAIIFSFWERNQPILGIIHSSSALE